MKQLLRKGMMILALALVPMGAAEAKRKPPKQPVKAALPVPAAKPAPLAPAAAPTLAPLNVRLLNAHNNERMAVGVPMLVWSDQLARDAAVWAKHSAQTNSFEHAPQRTGKDDQGENLWMGTKGAYTPEDMVGAWIDEKKLFKRGKFPNVSSTGNWVDVGHYTQLIWTNTTSVGCSIAENGTDEYLVCRYAPPGNWIGQSPFGDK